MQGLPAADVCKGLSAFYTRSYLCALFFMLEYTSYVKNIKQFAVLII